MATGGGAALSLPFTQRALQLRERFGQGAQGLIHAVIRFPLRLEVATHLDQDAEQCIVIAFIVIAISSHGIFSVRTGGARPRLPYETLAVPPEMANLKWPPSGEGRSHAFRGLSS